MQLVGCAALPQLFVAVGLAHVRDGHVRDLRAAALLVGRARPGVQARVPQALPRGRPRTALRRHGPPAAVCLFACLFVCLFACLFAPSVMCAPRRCAASRALIAWLGRKLGTLPPSPVLLCMAAANQTMPSCAAQHCTTLLNDAVIVGHATAGIADVVERRLCGLIQLP